MRLPLAGVVLVILWGCGPEALVGTPLGPDGVTELRHRIEVHFEEGQVRLAVTRTVFNDTDAEQSFVTGVPLPEGAIVTSLRLGRGSEPLLHAPLSTIERVHAEWAHLTSEGDAEPSPLGLLEWSCDGQVRLEVFAVPPRESVTIAYDVRAEPRYEAGVVVLEVPKGEGLLPRFDRASVEENDDAFIVRRQHVTRPVADVRWATAPLDTDRVLWRFEVDAAPELEARPVAPRVVFVVDASHSEGPAGIAAQLELIPPVLANVPDATAEVVIVRRAAERLFGRFLPAREVSVSLAAEAHRLLPGNGSNLDEGARLAAEALGEGDGPARVVLFTDERLRTGFSSGAAVEALRRLSPDTVVHVVARTAGADGSLAEARDDEAPLSAVAQARGGVFLRVTGSVGDPKVAAQTLLGLVRPVRVDGLHVDAEGLEVGAPDVLNEGETVRLHGLAAAPPSVVTVTGKVWARPFHRVVALDDALSRRLPGLAVGAADLRSQLEDDELRSAAFLAQAVSPVTAFLAAPPHATPSRVGGFGFGVGGVGSSSCGCGGSFTTLGGCGLRTPLLDLHGTLRRQLAPGLADCEARLGAPAAGHLTIETTVDEVVDVQARATSAAMGACLTEVAWALRLDEGFRFVSGHVWAVDLDGQAASPR